MKEIQTINKECVSNRVLIIRILFLQLLSFIYLISYISLYSQIQGLWGNLGIVPANIFLSKIKQKQFGLKCIISCPSIAYILNSDINSHQIENLLYILCIIGIFISLLIIFRYSFVFNFLGFSILWYIHYNFYLLGQEFMRFSWDELLLETGFISIFFSPLNLNGKKYINHITQINNIAFYILKYILFKFMISTGINIISSKCSYWNSFNGLNFFFEGQPLLSSFSYFFHSFLNSKMKRIISAFGYFCLIYLPFGYFLIWRRFNIFAGQITFIFNLFLIFAGNYGYLNLLVIDLNLLNFDDYYFRAIFSKNLLEYFKLDYLSPLIPLYVKEMKERKKILLNKENKVIEIKKELDEEKEKNENNKKIIELKNQYINAKKEVIKLVEDEYSDGPNILSSLKIESNISHEIFIFINFFCLNLILVYFLIYPINGLLSGSLTIKNKSSNKYKIILLVFSVLIYLYIISTIVLNFANKMKNSLFTEKSIFSSVITDIIKDTKNNKKNKDNEFDDDIVEENEEDINSSDYDGLRKNISKGKYFLNILLFIFNIIKYISFLVIFTIYFIGSVKYFLLNMDIPLFEEKVRNNKIANIFEKTNYGLYKYIISLSDSLFGNYNLYGIYGNIQKEITNVLGRSEIEIECLNKDNNKTWNTIDFKYKLGKNNTNPKFLFFHTPRLDFKLYETALNEDINDESWMVSLIGKIFQKNQVVLDLFNYDFDQKNNLKKISMFEKLKQIYLGRKNSALSNDEIDKIRIDIFKYKFHNYKTFQRKRYKEYLSQIEKYAIILVNEKLGLQKINFNEKIEFNLFQFIPIVDIVCIFILINLIINRF